LGPLIIKVEKKQLHKWLPLLLLLPLLGTRTGVTVTLETYLYFFPIYLLGVYASMNYNMIISTSERYFKALIIVVFVLISIIFMMVWHETDLTYSILSLKDGIVYLKCIMVGLVILNICHRIATKNVSSLNTLANYSFALYFLHDFINYRVVFISIKISDYFDFNGPSKMIWGLVWGFVVILITLLICVLAKKVFGKYSRSFIGA
jgi:hypothetical protein